MRIGYFADGPWSHNSLEKIIKDYRFEIIFICARYSSPDEFLKKRAKDLKIKFFIHKDINSDEFIEKIKNYKCDIFLSMSFDQIFRKRFFNIPPLGTINIHAGKLPFYRGRNIINWVLINDEDEFGITSHYVDEGIDTGDIIYQKTYPISDCDNYKTLLNKAYIECANVLIESLDKIEKGIAKRIPQKSISDKFIYCVKREVGDELINWEQNSRDIFNFIRALTEPGPGAISFLNGKKIVIKEASYIQNALNYKGIPGSIIGKTESQILVKSLDNYLILTKWSFEGKLSVGMRFKS